ncbi:MAG TPA: AAA family ATPase, partial [Thermoanaerobaculia bacterium]
MSATAASPRISLHQLSLYNTGRMSPEQIIVAFAARRQQLDRIVADIAAEKPKSRAQHHLIVGQRGMGKTMLLARIAAELRTDPKLAERFIPLVFVEEQYAVDRLSKFWLNCLDSLADARELAGDTAAVDEIDATVARLTTAGLRAAKDDQPFADEVYDAFAKLAKSIGQRPVLLVDNLQLVFERLDAGQQHSLRELLMRAGSPILIGASPSPPPQAQDYGAAFYDQFKVHYLRPLEEAEMRALLVHLADVAERPDVRQRVVEHPQRLTVLRQLTGGNPRTTLTLFFLYAEDFAPTVFGDLEGLLDRVTPLYKARFEELTPQQQVVASAIANHWDPITAAALTTATGLPSGTISSQLDRLEKTGFVERTELFGETRTGYQLAERFFNIWFLMRSASRRQRR